MTTERIEAPITGTVISIEVKAGDKVGEGDVILYIESMKMENPIMAPADGTITEVFISKGQVETGDNLATLEY